MKKIILGLTIIILAACTSTPFVANVDNALLEGNWKITNVDDAAAMISKEEFLLSAMHEKYKKDYIFHFEKGPKFNLKSLEGSVLISGKYGISSDSSSVTLQLEPDNSEISYDLEKSNSELTLKVTTPGELVNITISKQ